ncbi:MAG: GNAT family N-acetyltransferase [Lachnospiraceae bacterium]
MLNEYRKNGIILRILNENNARAVLNFYKKNEAFFQPVEAQKPDNYYTLEFTRQTLAAEAAQFMAKKAVRFFVFSEKKPTEIIGSISFQGIRWGAFMSCHVGYKIDRSHCQQGIGYRALSLALDIICSEWGIHRVEAYIHPDNISSIALAKKAGFVSEGIAYDYAFLDGKWTDHLRYIYISAYQ